MDRQQVFDLIRDRLSDILEVEPSTIHEGDSFTEITSGVNVGDQVVVVTQTTTGTGNTFPGGGFGGGGFGGGGFGGGAAGGGAGTGTGRGR